MRHQLSMQNGVGYDPRKFGELIGQSKTFMNFTNARLMGIQYPNDPTASTESRFEKMHQ
jgi:hypothetical protein